MKLIPLTFLRQRLLYICSFQEKCLLIFFLLFRCLSFYLNLCTKNTFSDEIVADNNHFSWNEFAVLVSSCTTCNYNTGNSWFIYRIVDGFSILCTHQHEHIKKIKTFATHNCRLWILIFSLMKKWSAFHWSRIEFDRRQKKNVGQ